MSNPTPTMAYLELKQLREHIDDALTLVYALDDGALKRAIIEKLKASLRQVDRAIEEGFPKHCERCGHDWQPRGAEIRICPKCKSPYWNQPKAGTAMTGCPHCGSTLVNLAESREPVCENNDCPWLRSNPGRWRPSDAFEAAGEAPPADRSAKEKAPRR